VNVLIIPEDFRKDQYILKPIIQRMFAEIGKPQANVKMCLEPVLGGIHQATDWGRIADILDMYPTVDIFLLIVDRDGIATRRRALNGIERNAREILDNDRVLLAENAWQEIEVWALAGQQLPRDWNWRKIRAEIHPKERYFEPLAKRRRLTKEPGEGRLTMGREAAARYARVRSRCKEDLQGLEVRLKAWLGAK